MPIILSSVGVVRVRFIRSTNNLALATLGLKATPTISRLTVPGQHGFIDLVPVASQVDPDTGVAFFDLVATDDAQVNETFGWTITGDGWSGFSRVVQVPQAGVIVEQVTVQGASRPAVWLNQLADFTGASGSTGPDGATQTYVDDALDAHEAAPDPHPQYALDSDVAAVRQVPSGGTTGQVVTKGSSGYAWADATGGGGGTATPDATTSVKGKAVLLGGTADAPTVPWTAVTGAPAIPAAYTDEQAQDAVGAALTGQTGKVSAVYDDGNNHYVLDVQNLTKADVGLNNVNNTADANKPVSTAQQAAIDAAATAASAADRSRPNHTGQQPSTSISDFTEAVQDAVAALLGAGSNVVLNYDDAANTLTVSATGSGGTGLDAEAVRDAIGVALVGVAPVSVVVNDAADTITISSTATQNATDAALRDRTTHTGKDPISALDTTGTASPSTFLRGDGAWAAVGDPMPEATTAPRTSAVAGSALLGKTNRADTSGGTFSQPAPVAAADGRFRWGWTAPVGTTATPPTLTADTTGAPPDVFLLADGTTATSIQARLPGQMLEFHAQITGSGQANRWLVVTDHRPQAALDSKLPAPTLKSFPGAFAPCGGTGLIVPVNVASNFQGGTWRVFCPVADPTATSFLPVWANILSNDTVPANAVTIAMAIEDNGTVLPYTFGGQSQISVTPGGWAIPDMPHKATPTTANTVQAGAVAVTGVWVRIYASVPASSQLPVGYNPQNFVGEATNAVAAGSPDLTVAGSGTVTGNNVVGPGPTLLLSVPHARKPIIGLVGDSIWSGIGDVTLGYGSRAAITAGVPIVKVSRTGEQAAAFMTVNGRRRRQALLEGCTHFIVDYGVNDLATNVGNLSATTLQTNLLNVWTALAGMGGRVFQTTIMPSNTSTDTFTTTGNQTQNIDNTKLSTMNDWLRAGAPIDPTTKAAVVVGTMGALVVGLPGHPLAGYLEVADAVMTARNSGLWKVNSTTSSGEYTTDGTHPTGLCNKTVLAPLLATLLGTFTA